MIPVAFKFKDKMFEKPWAPYYDRYKGHQFILAEFRNCNGVTDYTHVKLLCITDTSLDIVWYVHYNSLELVK